MPKSVCKINFSDVRPAISRFKRQVRKKMEEVGEEAVEYAVKNGNYQDRTGYLRSRNQAKADDKRLEVFNDAEYASYVEAKGYDVVGGAALYAEQRLKEIFE